MGKVWQMFHAIWEEVEKCGSTRESGDIFGEKKSSEKYLKI